MSRERWLILYCMAVGTLGWIWLLLSGSMSAPWPVLLLFLFLALLIEGWICAILIIPVFALLGGLAGLAMGAFCRMTNWPRQRVVSCIALLPLLGGAFEHHVPNADRVRTQTRELFVAAPPGQVWRELVDAHFPGSAWLRCSRDTLDALSQYKARNALPTWDATLTELLAAARGGEPAAALPGDGEDVGARPAGARLRRGRGCAAQGVVEQGGDEGGWHAHTVLSRSVDPVTDEDVRRRRTGRCLSEDEIEELGAGYAPHAIAGHR